MSISDDESGGDYGGLRALIREAEATAEAERERMHGCPLCGLALEYHARKNLLHCPMGHFQMAPGPGYRVN